MRVLLQHLPRDSAFLRSVHGDDAAWGLQEHLLALAVDHLAVGNWLFTAAHTDGDPPDQPDPIPRPGADDPGTSSARSASPAQITAFFASL
ncbi:hypothetical protein [Actinomadura yumaensis]|uniref:Uncharacterized protein n=1 Tax=Actinomadura yumaensis TaxID=111807 RepID=A0ABW2CUS9_9ACTN